MPPGKKKRRAAKKKLEAEYNLNKNALDNTISIPIETNQKEDGSSVVTETIVSESSQDVDDVNFTVEKLSGDSENVGAKVDITVEKKSGEVEKDFCNVPQQEAIPETISLAVEESTMSGVNVNVDDNVGNVKDGKNNEEVIPESRFITFEQSAMSTNDCFLSVFDDLQSQLHVPLLEGYLEDDNLVKDLEKTTKVCLDNDHVSGQVEQLRDRNRKKICQVLEEIENVKVSLKKLLQCLDNM